MLHCGFHLCNKDMPSRSISSVCRFDGFFPWRRIQHLYIFGRWRIYGDWARLVVLLVLWGWPFRLQGCRCFLQGCNEICGFPMTMGRCEQCWPWGNHWQGATTINQCLQPHKGVREVFPTPRGNVYLGLPPILVNRHIYGYISQAYCKIENILWDNKEVVSIYEHWD